MPAMRRTEPQARGVGEGVLRGAAMSIGGASRASARQRRLTTESLVVGYAMSRLDRRFLSAFAFAKWDAAFDAFGRALAIPPTSVKNLRDEFDPIHANPRKGWRNRPMLPNRARIAEEFESTSDAALIEFVRRILARDGEAIHDAIDLLAPPPGLAAAAAARILTGRRAEAFLLHNCRGILGHDPSHLRDAREDMSGFDFELRVEPSVYVEVKGLQGRVGDILFTDREWKEAGRHRERYWLVVVANALERPFANVVRDPSSQLEVRCIFEQAVRSSWRTRFHATEASNLADRVAEGD